MLLPLKRVGGLRRLDRVWRWSADDDTFVCRKRGQTTFLNCVTTFPQAGLAFNESICMQRKSSNATSGGSPPRKQTQSFNERNHEVPMRDGAATAPSMDQRAIRQPRYVRNDVLVHMQPYLWLVTCADTCFAASSVIDRVELPERRNHPYIIRETHFLTKYKL